MTARPIMELWREDLYHELGDKTLAWLVMENDRPHAPSLTFTWLFFAISPVYAPRRRWENPQITL